MSSGWWFLLMWLMWAIGFGSGYSLCAVRWHRRMFRVWNRLARNIEMDMRLPTGPEVTEILRQETS